MARKPAIFWKEVEVKDEFTGETRKEQHPCVRCDNCGRLVDTFTEPYYIVADKVICQKCYAPGRRYHGERV